MLGARVLSTSTRVFGDMQLMGGLLLGLSEFRSNSLGLLGVL